MAQGLQVYGLYYLPSVMVSFILNFTPLLVIALGIVFLGERPTRVQGVGFTVTMVGVALYFGHQGLGGNATGILLTALLAAGGRHTWCFHERFLRATNQTLPCTLLPPWGVGR